MVIGEKRTDRKGKRIGKFLPVILCFCLAGCRGQHAETYEEVDEREIVEVAQGTDNAVCPTQPERMDYPADSYEDIKEDENDTNVTIMIYLDAATLESGEEPFASYDMEQMLDAELSDRVNVLIQTGGTCSWENPDISTQTTQRYRIQDKTLVLVEDTGRQQDMTEADTLREFLIFCGQEAPADRYMLILWGHGRGPQIGYGMDDFQSPQKAMALEDMAAAIKAAGAEAGMTMEWIGFDVCLAGNLETVYALRDCCDYLAVSEDYEPAYGWQYTSLLEALSEDPALDNEALAQVIVDGFMEEAERSGDRGIMAVIDMSHAEALMQAWEDFCAVQGEKTIEALIRQIWTDTDLLTPVPTSPDGYITDDDLYSLQDYGLTDLWAICELAPSPEADSLMLLLQESVVCVDSFHMARTMCGLAVCYGD